MNEGKSIFSSHAKYKSYLLVIVAMSAMNELQCKIFLVHSLASY